MVLIILESKVWINSWSSGSFYEEPTFDLTLLVEVLERNAQVLEFLQRTAGRRQFVARLSADLDHELGELRIVLDVRLQKVDDCGRIEY